MSDTELLPHVKLHFNVKHPTIEESYVYGYECAKYEVSESENPFIFGTKEHEQWSNGWWDGFYGEVPLFELEPKEEKIIPANDNNYHEHKDSFVLKLFEISGVIVISALVGYQLLELVA